MNGPPRGPSVYNPLGHGAASEIADKALAGEHFTEPHYQRQAQRYLGHAVRALRGAGEVVSLSALVELLDPSDSGGFLARATRAAMPCDLRLPRIAHPPCSAPT